MSTFWLNGEGPTNTPAFNPATTKRILSELESSEGPLKTETTSSKLPVVEALAAFITSIPVRETRHENSMVTTEDTASWPPIAESNLPFFRGNMEPFQI